MTAAQRQPVTTSTNAPLPKSAFFTPTHYTINITTHRHTIRFNTTRYHFRHHFTTIYFTSSTPGFTSSICISAKDTHFITTYVYSYHPPLPLPDTQPFLEWMVFRGSGVEEAGGESASTPSLGRRIRDRLRQVGKNVSRYCWLVSWDVYWAYAREFISLWEWE